MMEQISIGGKSLIILFLQNNPIFSVLYNVYAITNPDIIKKNFTPKNPKEK
jgi:hypothetical protein